MDKKTLILIFFNSVFLATGIMLNLISCIQFNNWWPLLTILINLMAITFPTLCGGCSFYDDDLFAEQDGQITLASLSWMFLGIFIVIGYAVPVELYRSHSISQTGVFLTLAGGTIILAAVLLFVRLIYFKKDEARFYFI